MNQKQKAPKQPQDPYGRQGKVLTSAVQRLRGWVGSDPSRVPELADALVELTAHRLLGHGYAAAAADAQESVRRAAELLTANGPVGPYTAAGDASRYLTAVVHLATLQAAVGQPAVAGRTLEALQPLHEQLRELGLEAPLDLATALWALSTTSRAALAGGRREEANACADGALAGLAASGRQEDPELGYLPLDLARLAGDTRWAAGRPEESLSFLHLAKDRHDAITAGRLQEPGRLSPPLLERLAEPLFGLHRDLADRLRRSGESDLALVTRRNLVDLIRRLAPRLGVRAQVQLASALADLARDLSAVGRDDEAEVAATEAGTAVADWSGAEPTRLLVQSTRARVLTRTGHASEAVALLRRLLPAASAPSPSHALGLAALAEALRADGDEDSAQMAEESFRALAAQLVGSAAEDPEPAVLDLARGVVPPGDGPVSWSPLAADHPYVVAAPAAGAAHEASTAADGQQHTTAWLEAERTEAHRLELERSEQARVEAGRREAAEAEARRAAEERAAADQAQAEEARRVEAERRAAAEEAERLDRKRRREERLEAHRREVEQREAERAEAERAEAGRAGVEHDVEPQEAAASVGESAETEPEELQRLQSELDESRAGRHRHRRRRGRRSADPGGATRRRALGPGAAGDAGARARAGRARPRHAELARRPGRAVTGVRSGRRTSRSSSCCGRAPRPTWRPSARGCVRPWKRLRVSA